MKVNPPHIIQCSWKQKKFVVTVVMTAVVRKGNERRRRKTKTNLLAVCLLTLEK
jgi:hypothetical protein